MRTLIDISEEDLKLLNRLSKKAGKSRAELVRQAVSIYLEPHKGAKHVQGFNLWAARRLDGLAYQEKIRHE